MVHERIEYRSNALSLIPVFVEHCFISTRDIGKRRCCDAAGDSVLQHLSHAAIH